MDNGAPQADGLSSATPIEPASPSRPEASIPSAGEFIRSALTTEIERMLADLGNPPLIGRIFPNGWRNADRAGLTNLYELCRRTFQNRERAGV